MRFRLPFGFSAAETWIALLLLVVMAMAIAGAATPAPAENTDPGPAASVTGTPPPEIAAGELAWSRWLAAELTGDAEYQTFSQRRVDVLTDRLAIEVEWCVGHKAHECVRQARYYAVATGKPGAIVLLVGRGDYQRERVVYDQVVEEAARAGIAAVATLDVRSPDIGDCGEHLGLVPTVQR